MSNSKLVEINDVLETTANATKKYNSKQDYYEDDKTYFQMFHDNAEEIIKSTLPSSKYTSDENAGDFVLVVGDKKVDLSGYTKEDYAKLSDDLSHKLAAKEIIDTINSDPDLSDLNKMILNDDISVDTDRTYASINDINGNLIFSIESKNNDSSTSLNAENGFNYTSWSNNEGVNHPSLKSGLESTQSYLISSDYELEDKKPSKRLKM